MLSPNRPAKRNVIDILVGSAAMLVATCFVASSAMAFTCDDVRSLSTAQQDYWAKRLHISMQDRHRLWIACYRNYRPGPQAQLVFR